MREYTLIHNLTLPALTETKTTQNYLYGSQDVFGN